MSVVQASPRVRMGVLDGLRGIAIVLVLLSHTWVVAPKPGNPVLSLLFTSGDFAVSVFFVLGGFLATTAMLQQQERQGLIRPGVTFLRRWVRLSSQVYPLVVTVLVLTAIDSNMAAYRLNNTRESAWRIVTYTWNSYVRRHPLEARPDLGHLWYVCTDLWVVGLVVVLVYLLGRRRWALLTALVVAVAVVMVYRQHVYATEGEFVALIRVETRADGLLWGAMAAVALPWLRRFAPLAPRLGIAAALALVPLMALVRAGQERHYFGLAGWLLNLTLAMFTVSVAMAPPHRFVRVALASRLLVSLGRYSLVLYVWHFPIFWYVSRNTPDWSWQARTAVGYAATVVIAVLAQALIERPVQRWLGSEFWHPFDRGLLPGTMHHLRTRYRARRPGTVRDGADPAALRGGEPAPR